MLAWERGIQGEFKTFIKNEQCIDHKNENIKLENMNALCLDDNYVDTNDRNMSCDDDQLSVNSSIPATPSQNSLACDQCEYKAKSNSKLKIHIELVHGEVKYSCGQCYFETRYERYLKTHIEA